MRFFCRPRPNVALVVEYETEAQQAQPELTRIGFDQVAGFISADDLDETLQITQMGARDFLASLESPQRPLILDVRAAQEWITIIWRVRSIFRCRNCFDASEEFPEMRL